MAMGIQLLASFYCPAPPASSATPRGLRPRRAVATARRVSTARRAPLLRSRALEGGTATPKASDHRTSARPAPLAPRARLASSATRCAAKAPSSPKQANPNAPGARRASTRAAPAKQRASTARRATTAHRAHRPSCHARAGGTAAQRGCGKTFNAPLVPKARSAQLARFSTWRAARARCSPTPARALAPAAWRASS